MAGDRALRDHLADRIAKVRSELTESRQSLADAFVVDGVDRVGALAVRLRAVEEVLRRPDAGGSGRGPGGRFAAGELEGLYAGDQGGLEGVAHLEQAVVPLANAARVGDGVAVTAQIERFRGRIADFESAWQRRQRRVAGLE